jgi:hypothetical protein
MSVDFGGHFRLTYNGAPLTMRGKFEIDDNDLEISGVTNDDGSVSTVGKPAATKISVDFEDSNPASASPIVNWRVFMMGGPYNIMIYEDDTGTLHTCTGAKPIGRPKRNRSDGQISGIEFLVPRGGYSNTQA